jgi:hypothetical protein
MTNFVSMKVAAQNRHTIADGNRTHNGFPMGISADTFVNALGKTEVFPAVISSSRQKSPMGKLQSTCQREISERFSLRRTQLG